MSTTLGDPQAPVEDRLGVLQLVRVTLAVAVAALPPLVGTRGAPLSVPAAYLGVVLLAEVARRRQPRLTAPLLSALVLVDGAFLAGAVLLTGGTTSPLLFLAFLEVVAVTLLASPRTGLKLAVWCALLLFLGRTAAATGVLKLTTSGDDRAAALSGVAFLLFAVGAAVFQSVNEKALRRSGSELLGLVELGGKLEQAHRPDDVIAVLLDHLRTQLAFARVVAFVRGEDAWNVTGDVATPGRHGGGLGPVGDAVLEDGELRLARGLTRGLLAEQLPWAQNVVVAALPGEDGPLGLVATEWARGPQARIPELTVATVHQAVASAALTLRNARLLDEVRRLATRDELTGLANRRLFEETLSLEVGRHRRTGVPLSVVALDVDYFKRVNDEHGHPAGDTVLRLVASALRTATKAYDVPCRSGGDEFLVLLPGCGADDVVDAAERLRGVARLAVGPDVA
ncbi:MAG TPA: GGDEF domain-containing protein, partial [Acidimicrobiia bacterium]|nr:GGDEF domain-containing protein [Acidimicrobiia bacterium]